MSAKIDRLFNLITQQNDLLTKIITEQRKTNAVLFSTQLLTECVGPDGNPRNAEECGEIVSESFCAGLCISQELSEQQKGFEYQLQEFFLEDEEEEQDDDDNNQNGPIVDPRIKKF